MDENLRLEVFMSLGKEKEENQLSVAFDLDNHEQELSLRDVRDVLKAVLRMISHGEIEAAIIDIDSSMNPLEAQSGKVMKEMAWKIQKTNLPGFNRLHLQQHSRGANFVIATYTSANSNDSLSSDSDSTDFTTTMKGLQFAWGRSRDDSDRMDKYLLDESMSLRALYSHELKRGGTIPSHCIRLHLIPCEHAVVGAPVLKAKVVHAKRVEPDGHIAFTILVRQGTLEWAIQRRFSGKSASS